MLARLLIGVFFAVSVAACHRLSANERNVIGTWKQKDIDGTEYHILKPDHSYAWIVEVPDNDYKTFRRALACSGSWRIEGEYLIVNCTKLQWGERPPKEKKISDRWKAVEFVKVYEHHSPVSYETP